MNPTRTMTLLALLLTAALFPGADEAQAQAAPKAASSASGARTSPVAPRR